MSVNGIDSEDEADVTSSSIAMASTNTDDDRLIKAQWALQRIKSLLMRQDWKQELSTQGVTVLSNSTEKPRTYSARLSSLPQTTSPSAVIGMLQSADAWNSWYKETKIVETLSEEAQHVHVTLQGTPGSKDLSLVEIRHAQQDGSLILATCSVSSYKCPPVSGRARSSLMLSGYHVSAQNHITWFMQAHRASLLPTLSTKKTIPKHMAVSLAIMANKIQSGETNARLRSASVKSRKSLANSTFRRSLRKSSLHSQPPSQINVSATNGVPPIPNSATIDRSSQSNTSTTAAAKPVENVDAIDHAIPSTTKGKLSEDKQVEDSTREPCFPEDEERHSELFNRKQAEFDQLIKESAQWNQIVDRDGRSFCVKERKDALPIVKLELEINNQGGWTTEDVLACFTSGLMRKRCASLDFCPVLHVNVGREPGFQRFRAMTFEQDHIKESYHGIYPHLPEYTYPSIDTVKRSSSHSASPAITYFSASNPASSSQKCCLTLQALKISLNRTQKLKIVFLEQLDFSSGLKLPAGVKRAYALMLLSSFVELRNGLESFGKASGTTFHILPYFIRWSSPKMYIANATSSSSQQIEYTIKSKDSQLSSGKNLCWLDIPQQFSRGAHVTIKTGRKAFKAISIVKDFPRILQIEWNEDFNEEEACFTIEADEDQHFRVDGAALENFVDAPRSGRQLNSATATPSNASFIGTTGANGHDDGHSVRDAAMVTSADDRHLDNSEQDEDLPNVEDFLKDNQELIDLWAPKGTVTTLHPHGTLPLDFNTAQFAVMLIVGLSSFILGRQL